MRRYTFIERRKPAANSRFAIGGVSCSADSLVVAQSFMLRIWEIREDKLFLIKLKAYTVNFDL